MAMGDILPTTFSNCEYIWQYFAIKVSCCFFTHQHPNNQPTKICVPLTDNSRGVVSVCFAWVLNHAHTFFYQLCEIKKKLEFSFNH